MPKENQARVEPIGTGGVRYFVMQELADDKTPRCLDCDYPLVGLSEPRCPECGQAFDFADSTSYYSGDRPMGPVGQFFSKPPGSAFLATCAVSAMATLLSRAVPGGLDWLTGITILLWILLAGIWWVRLIGLVIVAVTHQFRGSARLRAHWKKWSAGPALLVISIVLCVFQVPLWLTFSVSKSSMDQLAAKVIKNAAPIKGPIWIGIVPARDCEPIAGGMRFGIAWSGPFEKGGFAYFVTPPNPVTQTNPIVLGSDFYYHMYANWYTWHDRW